MNFLKKLTGSAEGAAGGAETSVTSMVTQAAKSVGLDPKIIMMKLFQYFAGNLMGEDGKPAMDADKLKDMAHKTKIVDDKLKDADINDIFDKVKGKAGTIDFDGFQDSLKEMAKKKYADETKDVNTALKKLEDQIIDNAEDFIGD